MLMVVAVIIVLIVGGVLLLLRGSLFAKIVGTVSMLAGASLTFVSIKEVKLDALIKYVEQPSEGSSPSSGGMVHIDQIKFLSDLKNIFVTHLHQGNSTEAKSVEWRIDTRLVAEFKGFPIGSSELEKIPDSAEGIAKVCQSAQAVGGHQLYYIVGSTDRLPLAGHIQQQYEGNAGLAMARAAAVRDRIVANCGWNAEEAQSRLLLLTVGPLHTPTWKQNAELLASAGFPDDRSATVFALAIVTAAAPSAGSPSGSGKD